MRRLLLILLGWMALVPMLPAHASHRHPTACASCPQPTGDTMGCADHGCLGCSLAPETAHVVAPPTALAAAKPRAATSAKPTPHRPDFEPPPPRAFG